MRRLLFVAVGFLFASIAGCSPGSGVKYVSVTGKVIVNGQVPEGLLVTLVPKDGGDPLAPRPNGFVGADGTYKLSTYDVKNSTNHDGAPPGTYKITLSWTPLQRPGDPPPVEEKSKRKNESNDKLGNRYIDPARSPYTAIVNESPTELQLIEIKF